MEKKTSVLGWVVSFGALLGGLLATWLAPKAIAWYFSPPVEFGVNCKAPIEWGLKRLELAQFLGIIGGALTGLILYLVISKRHKPNY